MMIKKEKKKKKKQINKRKYIDNQLIISDQK